MTTRTRLSGLCMAVLLLTSAAGAASGPATFCLPSGANLAPLGGADDLGRRLVQHGLWRSEAAATHAVDVAVSEPAGRLGAFVPDQASMAADRPDWIVRPAAARSRLVVRIVDLATGRTVHRTAFERGAALPREQVLDEALATIAPRCR